MAASAGPDAGGSPGSPPEGSAHLAAGAPAGLSGQTMIAAKPADSLILRIASSAVLGPVTIAACWAGGPAFAALVAFLMVAMCFEWTRMVERRELTPAFLALGGAGAIAIGAAAFGAFPLAYAACVIAGAAGAAFASPGVRGWCGVAAAYVLAPCVALLWLREGVENGRGLTILLFAVVWAADTGGYFFGRLVGGPRLAPILSPAKTWAGAVGGIILGGAAGLVGGRLSFGGGDELAYAGIGGALGLISILGDMAESGFKRHFGVKDMSGFIPGHGGALDRLDGMIFATSAIALIIYGHILLARL